MIRVAHIEEPDLEFGGGQRHVDIRFGLTDNGPFDAVMESRPTEVRIGIVGTSETVEKSNAWIDQCQTGIIARESKQPHLFPAFPGLGKDGAFRCSFRTPANLQRTIRERDLREALARPSQPEIVRAAADLFAREVRDIAETVQPSVVLIAPRLLIPPANRVIRRRRRWWGP